MKTRNDGSSLAHGRHCGEHTCIEVLSVYSGGGGEHAAYVKAGLRQCCTVHTDHFVCNNDEITCVD